ncbi:MAG: hypothetical protein MI864_08650 [Pseudomonadales bacterium]|nr:hypothetical protein [Pseudomonadales bacterium]
MRERYMYWAERFSAISLRERIIVAVATLVVLLFVWAQFVFLPFEKAQKRLQTQARNTLDQQIALADELTLLQDKINQDPNIALRKQQRQLQRALLEQREQLEAKLEGLVAPDRMVDLLREVLSDFEGLKLMAINNLPAKPFLLAQDANVPESPSDTAADASEQTLLYQHEFEMTLEGSYFSALRYLQRLEEMNAGLTWSRLDYKVTRYPDASITVRVQTLSLDERWIGV